MSPTEATAVHEPTAAEVLWEVVQSLAGRGDLPLAVRAWDGSTAGHPDAPVTVVVRSPEAVRHVLWSPGELGLARAHVDGHLDFEGDVFTLLSLREHLGAPDDDVSLRARPRDWLRIARQARRLGVIGRRPPRPVEEASVRGRSGTIGRASTAVRHHYDVGNDFYRMLLGPALTYSCAYWNRPALSLEEAQDAKHELVCRKLGLQPGRRLLDIGCGWGSMAIHAARHHGAEVVGITLSSEQADLARERVRDAGLGHLVDVRIQDYREVDDGPFDAVSSIGMFEHVPSDQVGPYLQAVRRLVRPGGRILNHAISRPDPDVDAAVDPRSFMGRYVFPDSTLHEVGTVVSSMQRAGLEVRDVQSLREHYATTLRCWLANLEGSWDRAVETIGEGRARVWRLYLAGAALGFEQNRTSIHQVLAVNTPSTGISGVEPTRAHMEVPDAFGLVDLRNGSRPANTDPVAPSHQESGR